MFMGLIEAVAPAHYSGCSPLLLLALCHLLLVLTLSHGVWHLMYLSCIILLFLTLLLNVISAEGKDEYKYHFGDSDIT